MKSNHFPHRVAITGVGVVSCLGADVAQVETALREARSGVGIDPQRIDLGFRSPLTGRIVDFDLKQHLNRKQRKTMPDFAVWSHAAALEALAMGGVAVDELHNERTGLIFGCDSSCVAAVEQADVVRDEKDTQRIGSGAIFRSMTSTITMNLNTLLKTQGACWSISSACSSGGHAVGQAADLIALGRQDRVLCGGAQEITWESMCSFDGLGAFSTRTDAPESASRPFDKDRDGLVPSGGAAVVLLERMDMARARGAAILGEVLGYAFSSDGANISVPAPDGLARSMRGALQSAGLAPRDVDCLSAHATSTPAGDAAEAEAIRSVFGSDSSSGPDIICHKALTGHELWMSGASQVVYAALMARGGFLSAHPNFTGPDASCEGLNIPTTLVARAPMRMLLNAAGFGGTNSCLVLGFDG